MIVSLQDQNWRVKERNLISRRLPGKKKVKRKRKKDITNVEAVLLETVGLSRCSAALSKLELVPKLHAQIN